MKVFRVLLMMFVVGGLLSLPACNKDDSLNTRELLLAHSWHFSKATTTSTDSDVQNAVTLVQALLTGAVLEFNDDGTYVLTALNQSQPGFWDLSADEKQLLMGDDVNDLDPSTIKTINDGSLVMESTETDDEIGTYTVSLWWVK